MHLGCIAGLGASEGGASWGFMIWVCHYRGALIFGLGVIVCIVCYGTVWLPCHVFSSNVGWDALSACPLHVMCIDSVSGVSGAMSLLVTPTYVVSVFTKGDTVLLC